MGTITVATTYNRGGRSLVRAFFSGDLSLVPFTFTPSTSYATNGDTVAAASMPAGYKDLVTPWALTSMGGIGVYLDVTNSKLKFYAAADAQAGPQELASGTNLQTALGTGTQTVLFAVRA